MGWSDRLSLASDLFQLAEQDRQQTGDHRQSYRSPDLHTRLWLLHREGASQERYAAGVWRGYRDVVSEGLSGVPFGSP